MKKQSKRLISSILSIAVIASTIGATLSTAASDVKVKLVQTKYYTEHGKDFDYYMITGTQKRECYFNQTEYSFYKNAVKAGEYLKKLGFSYNNNIRVLNPNGTTQEKNVDTVYIAISNEDGREGSAMIGRDINGNNMYYSEKGNAKSTNGVIAIGQNDYNYMESFAYAPDVIAHEYVHLVTQQIAGWNAAVRSNSNENGAVVEAYSDILGELCETNPDWKMGTTVYYNNSNGTKCIRNLKDPKSTVRPVSRTEVSDDTYCKDYKEFEKTFLNAYKTEEGIYAGSTILSHAAYLMTTSGLKNDTIAKIWFDSLYLFDDPSNPTFSNCRKAVIAATEKYAADNDYSRRGRSELLGRVKWSFDSVYVY